MKVGPLGFEPRTASAPENIEATGEVLIAFRKWLGDSGYSRETQKEYPRRLRRLVSLTGGGVNEIKEFLKKLREKGYFSTYSNFLKVVAAYCRFRNKPNPLADFKFIHNYKPKHIIETEELRRFYNAIKTTKMRAFFLILASSGLRKGEVLSLTFDDIDFKNRMITPKCHTGRTKRSWVSFYNLEAQRALEEWLEERAKDGRSQKTNKIFPWDLSDFKREWAEAKKISGVNLRPKDLRDWFAQELGEKGVPDRYIDALQGRVPQSILARHYSDFSPRRLKMIYEQANLKILT
jgi:integrase